MIRYCIMKAEKIKQKIQQTKEKRKNQIPTIIQCKLQMVNFNRERNTADREIIQQHKEIHKPVWHRQ